MTEHTPESQEPFRSLSYQAMQTLWRAFPLLVRLAAAPFLLAVGAIVMARLVGPPMRYGFDGLHGLVLISYITAVSRVGESRASGALVTGPSVGGLAVPRPIWLGVRPLLSLVGEALLLMIPGAVVLFLATLFISAALFNMGLSVESLILDVVSILLPEFILNTLLGLVLGAGVAKILAERGSV